MVKHAGKILTIAGLTSLIALTIGTTNVYADASANASVTVPTACTLAGGNHNYYSSIAGGETKTFGPSSFKATCNDAAGYSLYAIGYSGDSYTGNNTKMIGTNTNIDTATSGNSSYWSMQVAAVAGTYAPTIMNSFDSNHTIPSTYTQIAKYTSATDTGTNPTGSNLEVSYTVSISPTQAVDTYTGKVKYTLVHPNNAPDPGKINLYDAVASMSKGKQTAAQLQAAITIPTSTDRTEDTSNSGVYEYGPSVFGTASDASNANKIYYYRGVLENSPGTYGSDGSAVTYPNYVKLGNTCWRIVRTTGSGGVKMIYNGLYGATTAGSCANTYAQVASSAFNGTSSTNQQIVRVGYTHNSTYAVNTSQSGTIAQIFGSNSNPGANDTRSDIKTYIEDTWYTGTNGVSAYTNMLEPSAGYCNDRTMNTATSWTTPLAESTTIASTYGTSDLQIYYFGAVPRTMSTAQLPSLACGNKYSQIDRSIVDLYRYNGTNGAAGSTTANYLKYPAALLTADEAALAGSGFSSSTTPYHANSFLRSGSDSWLLSPYTRGSGAFEFILASNGALTNGFVYYARGVRPAISLTSGTMATSGSGIATDPWVVDAP